MFRNNITSKGICIIILFITMGVSQVSLTIENIDTDNPSCADSQYTTQSTCEAAATCTDSQYTTQSTCETEGKKWSPKWSTGTLDIKMTNLAGCSSCSDNSFDNKAGCETYGSSDGGITKDGVWSFDATIDETTCKSDATNGDYFDGKVSGFQFQLLGIKVTGATGGTAEAAWGSLSISTSETTYNETTSTQTPSVVAFSLTGATIPGNSDGAVLTNITFLNYDGVGICFGEDTGQTGANIISDTAGGYLNTNWEDCHCASTSPVDCAGACGGTAVEDCAGACGGTAVEDCAGACGGTAEADCAGVCNGTTADADSDGVCDTADACADTASGATVNDDGCSESQQLSISQVDIVLPTEFSIAQNFPNPFNPVTSITFDVAEMDEVSLIVYDLTGKEVITLVSGTYTPGTYNVEWNAVNNAGDGIVSGMYICRYISSEKAITRKMLYLK